MRQFVFFLLFFSGSALAFGGLGPTYNGWNFSCRDLQNAQKLVEQETIKEDKAKLLYNLGLCEIQHVDLEQGIATLKKSAEMGVHAAAIDVADYYKSNGFELPQGEITENEKNLKIAIKYRKRALELMSVSDYPFNDPYGDYFDYERNHQLYLKTADGLGVIYINQFIDKIKFHRNTVDDTSIGEATVVALQNAQKAAQDCINIPHKEDVWEKSVYDRYMERCENRKNIAKALLSEEIKRLEAASTQCYKIKLSKCTAHKKLKEKCSIFI